MEAFRVRHSAAGQQRTLLLPVSFGVSSVTLLHILDNHLQTQKQRTGRTGFGLHVVHIVTSSAELSAVKSNEMMRLQERYLDHVFTVVPLSDVFDKFDAVADIGTDTTCTGSALDCEEKDNEIRLNRLFQSTESATSRADLLSILRTRLIVRLAQQNNYEAILLGDSTTRLAEKTLAETAKGRGFALPWHTADGESPHGIAFHYPMRDLLKKELVSHAQLADPPLTAVVFEQPTKAPVSSKNTTIDELMKQYFESVEESYPSIVANVVRTAGKLNTPELSSKDVRCKLCNLPVAQSGRGKQTEHDGQPPHDNAKLCHGCTRTLPEEAGTLLPGL